MKLKKRGKTLSRTSMIGGLLLPFCLLAGDPAPTVQAVKNPVQALQPKEKTAVTQTPAAPAAKSTLVYKVPCLTVRQDNTHGEISYRPMKFTRIADNQPLRVTISDDTPGGSGQTIHSSVWLAAVTAAMLRNDTMHGVTISVDFSGNVDGPSAGGVTCLAILSAIDGRPLPGDFAMTGTILPDGTIGVVGGVPEKMRAAAKAGVKRIFIPAFLRIYKNDKGEDVDLSRLAEELKLELHRVENISEAYAILHNLPYSDGGYINVRSMTKLPRATEDVLMAVYKDLRAKIAEKIKKQPKLAKDHSIDDYVLSPELAEDFYREGRLIPATLQIFRTWQAWEAKEKADLFVQNFFKEKNPQWDRIKYLREYHFRKLIFEFRAACDQYQKICREESRRLHKEHLNKHYKNADQLHGYFPFREGQTEITAQLEPVSFSPILDGKLEMLIRRRANEAELSHASEKELETYFDNEVDILKLICLSTLDQLPLDNFLGKFGDTLPKMKANKRAAEVERLFYSALCAANSVADENFQSSMEAWADSGRKNVAENETKLNPVFIPFLLMREHASNCHNQLLPDSETKASNPDYHLQASLNSQVSAFAMASAMLMIYGADRSNDFLPHLERNARNAAIRNINECVKAGVPCLASICDFESAEAAASSSNAPIYALISYWLASLYAKALLMSFQNK